MTEAVLEAPWLFGPSTGLLPWLASMFRQLRTAARSAAASKAERELAHLLEFAASRLGEPILRAGSLDELDDRLEEASSGSEVLQLNALASRIAAQLDLRDAIKAATEFASIMEDSLGEGPSRKLVAAGALLEAWACAVAGLLAETVPERPAAFAHVQATGESLLSRPDFPPEAARGIAAGLRADLCVFAFAHALEAGAPVAPWLAAALVDRFLESVREHLGLIASVRPSLVPLDVIPASERLDIRAIDERHARARTHSARMLADERRKRGLPPENG